MRGGSKKSSSKALCNYLHPCNHHRNHRVALVTGGGSGIGFEVARQLGLHGAKVGLFLNPSSEARARTTGLHTHRPSFLCHSGGHHGAAGAVSGEGRGSPEAGRHRSHMYV